MIRNKLRFHELFVDNYTHHENGRIWVSRNLQNSNISVDSSSDQYLHCRVTDPNGAFRFNMTVVYAMNIIDRRRNLWEDISNIAKNDEEPWCIIGDYNNVLRRRDKIGDRMVIVNEYMDL